MTGSLSYFRQMTENVSVNKNSICVIIKLKKRTELATSNQAFL